MVRCPPAYQPCRRLIIFVEVGGAVKILIRHYKQKQGATLYFHKHHRSVQ